MTGDGVQRRRRISPKISSSDGCCARRRLVDVVRLRRAAIGGTAPPVELGGAGAPASALTSASSADEWFRKYRRPAAVRHWRCPASLPDRAGNGGKGQDGDQRHHRPGPAGLAMAGRGRLGAVRMLAIGPGPARQHGRVIQHRRGAVVRDQVEARHRPAGRSPPCRGAPAISGRAAAGRRGASGDTPTRRPAARHRRSGH